MESRVRAILNGGPMTVDAIFEGLCQQTPGRVPTPSGINSLMWRMRKDNIIGLKYYLREEHMPADEPEEIETPRDRDQEREHSITMASLHMATELARINPMIAQNSQDFLVLANQIRAYIVNDGFPMTEVKEYPTVEQRYIDGLKKEPLPPEEDLIIDDLHGDDLLVNQKRTCDGGGRYCGLTLTEKHTPECGVTPVSRRNRGA